MELGGITRAAEALGVTQSAVSHMMSSLEEELGFALFERSTRRVSFTDAGQSFYVDCVKLMAGLDEALARAASKLNGKKNFLTVGIEGLMQCEVKAEALKAFERTHPEVDIIPKQIDRDRKYEDLLTYGRLGDVHLLRSLGKAHVSGYGAKYFNSIQLHNITALIRI